MNVVCLDLEGVLIPEIWIGLAERTGIDALRKTTRDNPDYDDLMRYRLALLDEHNLKIDDIQDVVSAMAPLPGAREFLDSLRERAQVIILSDTYYELGMPLMAQLGMPTLFCHRLSVADDGRISDYHIRIDDPKRRAVKALHGLNFKIVAAGDSYNDTTMLSEAEAGILFCPPDSVVAEFPQYPVARDYPTLRREIDSAMAGF